jgi:hypothetical protein
MERFDTEESTVKFQRERRQKIYEGLKKAGYDISISEVDMFGEFMDYVRQTGLDMAFYTSTYKESETGYRSVRREHTSKEIGQIKSYFELWKEEKRLPLDLIVR